VIVDGLPWRRPFEFLLSGWRLCALMTLSILIWARSCREGSREDRRTAVLRGVGLALPALYIAAVTIVFESGENMRYRFFLEPTLFVFAWISISRGLSLWFGKTAA
jgi:cytochrome bd-type quinol oxidase subunit 2